MIKTIEAKRENAIPIRSVLMKSNVEWMEHSNGNIFLFILAGDESQVEEVISEVQDTISQADMMEWHYEVHCDAGETIYSTSFRSYLKELKIEVENVIDRMLNDDPYHLVQVSKVDGVIIEKSFINQIDVVDNRTNAVLRKVVIKKSAT